MTKTNIFNSFPRTFWVANTLELFERWAYYGMFALISVYLSDPVSIGGLGFADNQRGVMLAIVTALLYLLPILGGAIADRFGFKKVLLSAFVTLAAGYFAMGHFSTYAMVFASFLLVAIGGALFKPIIVATVSKTTNDKNDTLGFGIFYMIVNIGGFIGPFVASKLRDLDWSYVFIMCTVVILFNIVILYFYKEPERETKEKETLREGLKKVISNTATVLKDSKFLMFLIIMVGMWTMYMQLFFTLPIYITQWINTNGIYNSLPDIIRSLIGTVENGNGIIRPELMINIPTLTIIIFMVIMSNRLKNVKPIVSMIFGIFVIALAFGQMSYSTAGLFVVIGLVILAFGEMASSPRIQEYIGRIAPKEKVALYMGYSFLPVAGGNLIGGLLSGSLYASMSNKYTFLRDYLVVNKINIAGSETMDDGQFYQSALEKLDLSSSELDIILFNQYQPGNIWLVFASIGIVTSILLFVYNKFVLNKK